MLKFDDYDLEMVADILMKTNKDIGFKTKDDLVSFMKSMAYQHLYEKGTTISTAGFLLTAYMRCTFKTSLILKCFKC